VDWIICCGKPTGSLLRRHVLKPSYSDWNKTTKGISYKKLENGPTIFYCYHAVAPKKQK
jgi:hypothetical protein